MKGTRTARIGPEAQELIRMKKEGAKDEATALDSAITELKKKSETTNVRVSPELMHEFRKVIKEEVEQAIAGVRGY